MLLFFIFVFTIGIFIHSSQTIYIYIYIIHLLINQSIKISNNYSFLLAIHWIVPLFPPRIHILSSPPSLHSLYFIHFFSNNISPPFYTMANLTIMRSKFLPGRYSWWNLIKLSSIPWWITYIPENDVMDPLNRFFFFLKWTENTVIVHSQMKVSIFPLSVHFTSVSIILLDCVTIKSSCLLTVFSQEQLGSSTSQTLLLQRVHDVNMLVMHDGNDAKNDDSDGS